LVVSATSLTFPLKNPPAVEPVHNPKNVQAKNLLINKQPINTDNGSIPNQINLTTKCPTNLPNPIDLSSQNQNKNLIPKTLPVTSSVTLHLTLQAALFYPLLALIPMTLQRSLTKRNLKPQSPFQNYILRSKLSNPNYKP
jgi:hypothetical protein